MSRSFGILERLSQLSPRERRLLSLAAILAVGVGLIYGVMLPGFAAARSAESRLAAAATERNDAHALAATIQATAGMTDTESLQQRVAAAGFTVVDADTDSVRVHASGPAQMLAWVAGEGAQITLSGVTIEPAAGGGVLAELRVSPAQ